MDGSGKTSGFIPDFTPVAQELRDAEQIVRPSTRYWPEVGRRLMRSRMAVLCLGILAVIVLLSIFVPVFSPYRYDATNLKLKYVKPCAEHPFGTDSLGRDVFTRIWMGARASLLIGILGAFAPYIIGMIVGAASGWYGGWVDMVLMRLVDIMICIPAMIYMILILMVMRGSIQSMVVAMAVGGWMGAARGFRGRVLQFKNREFTLAARVLGASPKRIIFRHILPNILGNMAVSLTASIPGAIFMEAGMSYIGLGISPPMTSLGQLSADGVKLYMTRFYMFIIPTIVIGIIIFTFYMFGNCLRDALDPKLRDEEFNLHAMRRLAWKKLASRRKGTHA
jgi:oligopeptide transport system permease protein